MYIVIEGQDGTGKDTQAKKLAEYFEKQGQKVVLYAESGTGSDDPFVTEIAKLNYGSNQDIGPRTRALLYLVNRYEQWRKLAEPALKRGDTVITTRNWFSTLIYVGYGAGVSRSAITKIHKAILPKNYFHPDKIVVLTISPDEQEKRLLSQADAKWKRSEEFWKSKGDVFQQKINAAYLKVAKDYNLPVVSTDGTIEEVFNEVLKVITTDIAGDSNPKSKLKRKSARCTKVGNHF